VPPEYILESDLRRHIPPSSKLVIDMRGAADSVSVPIGESAEAAAAAAAAARTTKTTAGVGGDVSKNPVVSISFSSIQLFELVAISVVMSVTIVGFCVFNRPSAADFTMSCLLVIVHNGSIETM